MENENHVLKKKQDYEFYAQLAIIGAFLLLVGYSVGSVGITGNTMGASILPGVSAASIIPTGVPAVYGSGMGVSYDDVSPNNPRLADTTIRILSEYEGADLDSAQLGRYIKVAGAISCEYCCGAESIIFSNGDSACGCAHSYAMRGLAKYLILKHPEISDEDILSELGKWKVLFFPGIHEQKAQVLEDNGIDSSNYINLASNLYRGIEKGQSRGGGMVGGC